ncbi:MAG: hypothetical protein ABJB85_03555 [Nitrososphaerota archaeon]
MAEKIQALHCLELLNGLSSIMINTNWSPVNENLAIRCLTINHDKGVVIE